MYKDRKQKDVPVVNYIFGDSLKQRVRDAETVINIHNAMEKILSLLPYLVPNEDVKLAEVDLGREYIDVPLTSKESKLRVLTGDMTFTNLNWAVHFMLKCGGPVVSKWQQKVLAWQLAHPSGTAEDYLKCMKETVSSKPRLGQWQCVIFRELNGSEGEYITPTKEDLSNCPELSSPMVNYVQTGKNRPGFVSVSDSRMYAPIVLVMDDCLDEPHL
ncbi:hypothetical protein M0R45_006208 [Rubus argutus]|uniref:Uncharacterized protein n=1 Tax=Rubus argutus TaxID=59490 RepID=A0AAW1YPT1_RUBAR